MPLLDPRVTAMDRFTDDAVRDAIQRARVPNMARRRRGLGKLSNDCKTVPLEGARHVGEQRDIVLDRRPCAEKPARRSDP